MKNLVALVTVFVLSISLVACDRIADQLPLSGLRGYASCLKEGKKAGVVSQAALKVFCSARYQTSLALTDAQTNGHAVLANCLPEVDLTSPENLALERTCTNFEGSLENKTTDYVITSIAVMISNDRTKTSETKNIDNLWIEPNDSVPFSVTLDSPFKRKNWNAPNDKFEWALANAKGFKIDY